MIDRGYSSITGIISLGTPPQEFNCFFDFDSPGLYVVDANGVYTDGSAVTDKQTYNSSASSSYAASNADFSPTHVYTNGTTASDALWVGGNLLGSVTVEDASQANITLQKRPHDGSFGLSSTMVDKNTNTSLLKQLQSSLDFPVYTLSLDSPCPGSVNYTGQITFGGLAPNICRNDSWTVLSDNGVEYSLPVFNVTGLNTTGDSGGVNASADTSLQAYVNQRSDVIYTNQQAMVIFVNASGAVYNNQSGEYELTADQAASAQPVVLNLVSGGVLLLNREDYTRNAVSRP